MNKSSGNAEPKKLITNNRKARHQYHIQETFQAGIALMGTEVKAIREGKVNLNESYCMVDKGEVYLLGCHIGPYSHANKENHEPLRKRKLLLHKEEIIKIFTKLKTKGFALVPLKMYFLRGRIKVDIGLGRGKKLHDKREDIKNRDLEREMRHHSKYA